MTKRYCDMCGTDLTGRAIFHCATHYDLDFCWSCCKEHTHAQVD